MPDPYPASEFGGKNTKNIVQPAVSPAGKTGHTPTPGERLGLFYRTMREDASGTQDVDLFHGLLTKIEQTKVMEQSGAFEKGVDLD
jgi:hypothetical protein